MMPLKGVETDAPKLSLQNVDLCAQRQTYLSILFTNVKDLTYRAEAREMKKKIKMRKKY